MFKLLPLGSEPLPQEVSAISIIAAPTVPKLFNFLEDFIFSVSLLSVKVVVKPFIFKISFKDEKLQP